MKTSKLIFKIHYKEIMDVLDEFRKVNDCHQPYLNRYLSEMNNNAKRIFRKSLIDDSSIKGGVDEFLGDDLPPSRQEAIFNKIQKDYSIFYENAIAQEQKERELRALISKEFGKTFLKAAESKIDKLSKEIMSMMPNRDVIAEAKRNSIDPLDVLRYSSNKTSKQFICDVFVQYMANK